MQGPDRQPVLRDLGRRGRNFQQFAQIGPHVHRALRCDIEQVRIAWHRTPAAIRFIDQPFNQMLGIEAGERIVVHFGRVQQRFDIARVIAPETGHQTDSVQDPATTSRPRGSTGCCPRSVAAKIRVWPEPHHRS